jgi:nucleoside diphosphate kinase
LAAVTWSIDSRAGPCRQVARGHVGEAISRFERAGLELVEIRVRGRAAKSSPANTRHPP